MIDVIFGVGVIILWILMTVLGLSSKYRDLVKNWIRQKLEYSHLLVLGLSIIAVLGSLTYSEIIGYEPCKLCWYQRIFMYPIVLISFIAYVYRDWRAKFYIQALALGGLLISIYHIIEQRIPQSGLSCGTVGQGVACDSLWVNAFGVITIPTMAATIFTAIFIISLLTVNNSSN